MSGASGPRIIGVASDGTKYSIGTVDGVTYDCSHLTFDHYIIQSEKRVAMCVEGERFTVQAGPEIQEREPDSEEQPTDSTDTPGEPEQPKGPVIIKRSDTVVNSYTGNNGYMLEWSVWQKIDPRPENVSAGPRHYEILSDGELIASTSVIASDVSNMPVIPRANVTKAIYDMYKAGKQLSIVQIEIPEKR